MLPSRKIAINVGQWARSTYALKVYLVGALVAGFWALINETDFSVLPDQLYWTFSPLVVLSVVVFWLVLSWVWQLNLRLTVNQRIGLISAYRQVVMLLVGKYLPGKVWGIFARTSDAVIRERVSATSNYVAAYLEQLISVHAGILFGLGFLVASRPQVEWIIAFWSVALLSLLVVPRLHHSLLAWAVQRVLRKKPIELQAINGVAISAADYSRLFIAYMAEWLVTGGILVAVQLWISGEWPGTELLMLLLGSYAIAMVAGFVAIFAPGGIGVREGVMVALLASTLGLEQATMLAVSARLVMVCADLAAGAVVAVLGRYSR